MFARSAYWCIVQTLESVGLFTLPYRAFVPSFGEWGFVIASPSRLARPVHLPITNLRYLSDTLLPSLFEFSKDMARVPTSRNRLNNQALVKYYLEEWGRWE
jgi:spermidine synthase